MASHSRSENGSVDEAVRHAAAKLSSDLSRTARDAREAAEELADALRRSAGDVADKARHRAADAAHTVQDEVRTHPIAWLGAAAGIGALIGVLLASRR